MMNLLHLGVFGKETRSDLHSVGVLAVAYCCSVLYINL